jgi:NitT/TauT family transport system substrate-binding protein
VAVVKRTMMIGATALVGLLALTPLVPAAAQGAHAWKHGAILAKSDAGFFFMVQNGFAEKQGVKLEIVQFKTDILALQALIAGEIDSFEGGPGGSMIASSRGGDLKVLGCDWPGLPYGIFTRKDVKSLAELKGKTFASSAPSANPSEVARGILEKYGVDPATVHFASLGGDLDRFKAVAAGVAAGAIVSNEYVPIADKQGVKMLVAARDALPNYIRQCLISSAKVLAAKQDTAVRFMAAEMTAWHYATTHRDETLTLTRKVAGIKADDPRPEFVYDDGMRSHAIDPDFTIPVDKLKWMNEQLVKDGNLKQPIDVDKVIDPGIRAKALALLGAK